MVDKMLKLIPPVRRPWNPAYREVWDAMSDRDRRISTLLDVAACAFFILGLLVFTL